MESTKIEWADDTVNPWWGCVEVSSACTHCYARTLAKRVGRDLWGQSADRWLRLDAATRELERIAARGDREGRPRRVFIASMADVFEDRDDLRDPRARLFEVLHRLSGRLIPMLLTKRAEFMVQEFARLGVPAGAWVGVTAEDQRRLDERVGWLLKVPASVRFLSMEPLLGPVELPWWAFGSNLDDYRRSIGWVIVGGESGANARPMHPGGVRSLRDQTVRAGVPFFFKQWGEWAPEPSAAADGDMMFPDGTRMVRAGKRAAGRRLDGRTWDELPDYGRGGGR